MEATRCSRCDSPLAGGALAGQCPRCLGRLAFGTEPGSAPAPAAAGRLGDLELGRELGRGGMGVVYEARQPSLNRRVAVKMLPGFGFARTELERRFRAEAEAAARLRHPNIVTVYEVGELEGRPYFAMEWVSGPSLAEVTRTGPVAPRKAARYLRLAAEGIAHAHAAGVLHRDLKPSNILLDDSDQPRITDFGLAKLIDSASDLTLTGELLGSPNYLPPERVAGGEVGVAGDIYSLGAILYQLLTARPPFAGDSVAATLEQVVRGDLVSPRTLNPSVPIDLETICLECLRREPARRYGSAAELAADLGRFEAGEPVRARPLSLVERGVSWGRREPAFAAVLGLLGVVFVAGLVGVLAQWRRAETGRREMARHLYAADVAAAAAALRDGDLGRARGLLGRHAPGDRATTGSRERRGTVEDGAEDGSEDPESSSEFTWRWLWDRCRGDDLTVLGEHPWIVTTVAVSPDGRWVASGSQERPGVAESCLRIRAIDGMAEAGGSVRSFAASNTIWSVAFSADGRTLISAGTGGVRFWDVATGGRRSDFPELPGYELARSGGVLVTSPNHPFFDAAAPAALVRFDFGTREVRTLTIRGRHPALSPDGTRLAVLDGERNVRMYDLATERLMVTVATNHLVFRLRFSPDGNALVAAGRMTSAKLWDLNRPGSPPRVFRSTHNVWDAVFTPDGTTLVTGTSHQQLEIWDAATAVRRGSLSGHDNEVWTVCPTPDGRHLISGGKDRTVRLWSMAPKPGATTRPHWRHARASFSPDGSRLLAYAQTNGRGSATIWNWARRGVKERGGPESAGSLAGYPRGFAPDPDGRSVLFVDGGGEALHWRRPGLGAPVRTVPLEGVTSPLVLSEFALAGDARSFACLDRDGDFRRWSTEDGRKLGGWSSEAVAARVRAAFAGGRGPDRLFRSLAASRTGRWLALGTFDSGTSSLVDFEAGTEHVLRGHRDDVAALAFSWDERRLATGSVDGTIRLWEVPTGRALAELPGHMESVEAVAFSPDGRTLASINPGIEIAFWHLPTRRELARVAHPEAGYHLVFSPDGRRLAIGVTEGNLGTESDRVEIWEAP